MKFVTRTNWVLLAMLGIAGFCHSPKFAAGIIAGGLIVTVNFHLLYRTLRGALTPPYLASYHSVLAKYYVRFFVSGIIIFFLLFSGVVHPIGLFVGLSIVVFSIVMATILEVKKLILKEAI